MSSKKPMREYYTYAECIRSDKEKTLTIEERTREANDRMEYASQHHILTLNNNEASCGRCPMSLLCFQRRSLSEFNRGYIFVVCEVCWCVHFVHRTNSGPLYICGNIRRGLHEPPFKRGSQASRLTPCGYVQRRLGYYKYTRWEVRQPTCGCNEATMADIFPEDYEDVPRPRHFGGRHFTPLDPPFGQKEMVAHSPLGELINGFDCCTSKIHKRAVRIEER